jgi:lipoprotein-anchoring transpeptidase ErfK/SrfK
MKFKSEKQFEKKSIVLIFSFALIALFSACEAPPTAVNTNSANTNTNLTNTNSAPAPVTAPKNNEAELRMPVTLPVLDAMFFDENFANELKTKLQLTDEEVDKLKKAARDAVANLNEDETDTGGGSTRAATERANTRIRELLGEERTARLFELVRNRWSNEADEANNNSGNSGGKPNSIPTDTRIVVNAPAYRMDLFQDGKIVKSYKIGIGYPEFPLPSGMRKADTIIFNPTWTPPDEAWVKGKLEPGKTVEAGSKDNPLGPIKIPIGLPSLIHGGKSPARLGGFASHGCVGLTNPQVQDFAMNLSKIAGTEITTQEIKNYEKQKTETKNVKLQKTVPVELRYETIVVEDGKLRIFRDVYERGTNTEENLRRVLDSYGVSLDSLKDREKILQGLKQMAFDATGQPVETTGNQKANANTKNQYE